MGRDVFIRNRRRLSLRGGVLRLCFLMFFGGFAGPFDLGEDGHGRVATEMEDKHGDNAKILRKTLSLCVRRSGGPCSLGPKYI